MEKSSLFGILKNKVISKKDVITDLSDMISTASDKIDAASKTIEKVSDSIGNIQDTISNKGLKGIMPEALVNLTESLTGFLSTISPDTKRIVILGTKGVGKTTLWKKLQGLEISDTRPTDKEKTDSFRVKFGGNVVKVSDSTDIGGGNDFVRNYDKLIGNGTFIFYLVDLSTLHERGMKDQIRARLYKISTIVKKKKLKNCGCKILATNLKKYGESGLEKKYGSPVAYVMKSLNWQDRGKLAMEVDDFIIPVELTNDNDIKKIKQTITKV